MNQISKTYSTHRYLQRLLLSFLCISIIPLGACVIAILYANYKMSMETHTKMVQAVSDDSVQKLEAAVFEYERIAASIAGNETIIRIMEEDIGEGFEADVRPLVASLLTGRENRIRIQILALGRQDFQVSGGVESSLYHPGIYTEWGLLYELSQPGVSLILAANPYSDENGRQLCFSLGNPVLNQHDKLIGYVVVEIYRDTLLELLSSAESSEAGTLLLDPAGVTVLDTVDRNREGRLETERKEDGNISFVQALLGNKKDSPIYADSRSAEYGFTLFSYQNISDFYAGMELLVRISLLLFCITVVFCMAAAALLAKHLYGPVVEETRRQKDAEIKALQAQISPHFLYNMLNEIKALAKLGRTSEIADFVVHLGRLLRHSITFQEAFVEVRREIEFINDYLALQQIRYERSISIDIDVETKIMGCLIPKLILQPIVENCILHGFADHNKTHELRITGRMEDSKICFEVYDNGVGVDEDYISYINNVEKGSGIYGGLGVENVQKRLLLTYGKKYGLHIDSRIGEYTCVSIVLPCGQKQ